MEPGWDRGRGGRVETIGSIGLRDLTSELVWPALFRAVPLALQPSRVIVSFLFVAFTGSWLTLVGSVTGAGSSVAHAWSRAREPWLHAWGAAPTALSQPDWMRTAGAAIWELFVGVPVMMIREEPLAVLLAAPVLALLWCVAGAALARMSAEDMAKGILTPWPRGVAFGLARARSSLGALLAMPMVVWLIVAVLAAGGWVLLRWPVLNLGGGVLYGLTLAGGLLAATVGTAFVLTHAMLIPAVSCEGTDAMDAVQRCFAYLVNRPGRLVAYALVLLAQGVLLHAALSWIVGGGAYLAAAAAGAWAGPRGSEAADPLRLLVTNAPAAEGTFAATTWLTHAWTTALAMVFMSVLVSFYHAAGTVLYLLMRRVNDGQEPSDLWFPGMIEGTMAESLRGTGERLTTEGNSGTTASAQSPAPDEIEDRA
ncbi:MAG: hypothetical protein JNM07_12670 [Phycisphaerae bacterium]|nr:hypothetical protein [Phycisphaerae bacterium]